MGERLFLEIAHDAVRPVDLRGHARTIAMLGLDGRGETRIVRPYLQLERPTPGREAFLERLDPGALLLVQIELLVKKIVKRARLLAARIGYRAADEHADQCGEEGQHRHEDDSAAECADAPHPPSS